MNLNEALSQIKGLLAEKKFEEIEDLAFDLLMDHPDEFELLMLLGQAAEEGHNFSRADYYFIKAKRIAPQNTQPLFHLAALRNAGGDHEAAQEYYNAILKIDPDNIAAACYVADMLYSSGNYAGAAEKYSAVLSIADAKEKLSSEEFYLAVYRAVESYLSLREYDKGLAFIDSHAEEFNENVFLIKRKIYVAMGEEHLPDVLACTEMLHANVQDKAIYAIQLADYLDSTSDNSRVEGLYSKALELNPEGDLKIQALLGRSSIRMEKENWSGALEDLDALVELQKEWFPYQKRAEVKEQLKDVKGAIQDISVAMKLMGSDYGPFYEYRGKLYMKLGGVDRAIADFDKMRTLSQDDNDADAYYNLGVAYNKKKDRSAAVKMLMRAEVLGHEKARAFLLSKYPEPLMKVRTKTAAKFKAEYEKEAERNQRSPILSKAFGKLWTPNMPIFLKTVEEELKTFPGEIMKNMLAQAAKDLFLITPQGILFMEGDDEPLEAYYKVEVESEHSILLELQPTKGGQTSSMRLSNFEGNLLVSYPIGEVEVPAKYFRPADAASEDQKTRLTSKKLNVPYMESIENSIAEVTA